MIFGICLVKHTSVVSALSPSSPALQVISSARIRELNYERNVAREMAVLQLMSHPGVARLVSSFR